MSVRTQPRFLRVLLLPPGYLTVTVVLYQKAFVAKKKRRCSQLRYSALREFKQWDTVTYTIKPASCSAEPEGTGQTETRTFQNLWRIGRFLPSSKEQKLYFQNRSEDWEPFEPFLVFSGAEVVTEKARQARYWATNKPSEASSDRRAGMGGKADGKAAHYPHFSRALILSQKPFLAESESA